jgi:hypothetical protein
MFDGHVCVSVFGKLLATEYTIGGSLALLTIPDPIEGLGGSSCQPARSVMPGPRRLSGGLAGCPIVRIVVGTGRPASGTQSTWLNGKKVGVS